jgi:hypothetical protein
MDLEADSKLVDYEFKQLVGSLLEATTSRTRRASAEEAVPPDDATIDQETLRSNCFISANLVAARNLIYFFDARSNRADDILHADFLGGATLEESPGLAEVRAERDRISKTLAHLTRARHDYEGDPWFLIRITRLLLEEGARFVAATRAIGPDRGAWFAGVDHARDVFGKLFPPETLG